MWGLGGLLPASPTEGVALSVSELGRRGVARQRAITMLLVAGWCQFWALVLTAATASAVVDAVGHPDPDDANRLLVGAAVLVVVTVIVVMLVRQPVISKLVADAMWLLPHRRKMTRDEMRAAGIGEQARLIALFGRPAHRVAIAAASTGWWIADAGGLWIALHAAHAYVDFGLVSLPTWPVPSRPGCRSCPVGWARWRSRFPRCFTISVSPSTLRWPGHCCGEGCHCSCPPRPALLRTPVFERRAPSPVRDDHRHDAGARHR